jgi:hypothetical protein
MGGLEWGKSVVGIARLLGCAFGWWAQAVNSSGAVAPPSVQFPRTFPGAKFQGWEDVSSFRANLCLRYQ